MLNNLLRKQNEMLQRKATGPSHRNSDARWQTSNSKDGLIQKSFAATPSLCAEKPMNHVGWKNFRVAKETWKNERWFWRQKKSGVFLPLDFIYPRLLFLRMKLKNHFTSRLFLTDLFLCFPLRSILTEPLTLCRTTEFYQEEFRCQRKKNKKFLNQKSVRGDYYFFKFCAWFFRKNYFPMQNSLKITSNKSSL